MFRGNVTFIGAGCGRADLITLRGKRALEECDTVIYDSLIDERLLDMCSPYAEKIPVGKRAGKHSYKQEDINKLLVQKIEEGKCVARLKGGDSFVFGRGGEEIEYLKKNNVYFTLIPGVTSAVAVPELSGIPVTHRGVSRSFHVITGHTADDLLPENLSVYAKLNGTLVFLMGLRNISEITHGLMSGGMNPQTPAAVICQGGTTQQSKISGTLENIAQLSVEKNAVTPAVIVIGQTAALDFEPNVDIPFKGMTFAVTSTERTSQKLMSRIEELGGDAFRAGTLKIREYRENPALDKALDSLKSYGWITLTSPKGAEIFIERLRKRRIDMRKLSGIRFAVIGNGTGDILERAGIYSDLKPLKFNSTALAEVLVKCVKKGERVLIPRSAEGSPELTDILTRAEVDFDDIPCYEPVYPTEKTGKTIDATFVIFTSKSGVNAFFEGGYDFSDTTMPLCIGASTAQALVKHKRVPPLMPHQSSVDGLIDIIREVTLR